MRLYYEKATVSELDITITHNHERTAHQIELAPTYNITT